LNINDIALLHLQETYCLPILVYAASHYILMISKLMSDELNACWNLVIHRVFGYHKWESVSAVLLGLGQLKTSHYGA